ncbi:DMT family transporter [Psychromicrobium lacuslunae]|uniref:EamA domain-containing protein n=1 Tax=Psychromicrobium lacuslunae TaxID=1618207 RepID=A0A0D4BYV7_9MICC|nr:DMT family transporter [Psychromicrobium lacuslunae]AJT41489.1 hypothetical protein UM93_08110 [Psychromicrobium lacuslunae]
MSGDIGGEQPGELGGTVASGSHPGQPEPKQVQPGEQQPGLSRAAVLAMCCALALLLAATWILSGVLVEHNEAQTVAAGRSLFSCLGLLLIALRSRGALQRSVAMVVHRPLALLISGLLGVSIYALFSLYAISSVGTSVTNLVIAMAPALSLVFGVLFFRQRSGWMAVTAVLVAVAGAAIYVLGSFDSSATDQSTWLWGVAAALLAVCSIALYGQHYAGISKGHKPSDLLLGIFCFGTVVLLLVMAVNGSLAGFLSIAPIDWLWFFVLGVLIYVPVYIIQHRLIHEKGAVFTATVSLAVPFVVRAAEVLIFGKPWPNGAEIVGLLLCVAGIAVVVRLGTSKPSRGEPGSPPAR